MLSGSARELRDWLARHAGTVHCVPGLDAPELTRIGPGGDPGASPPGYGERVIKNDTLFDTARATPLGWQYTDWDHSVTNQQFPGGEGTAEVVYQSPGGGLFVHELTIRFPDAGDLFVLVSMLTVFGLPLSVLALSYVIGPMLGLLVSTTSLVAGSVALAKVRRIGEQTIKQVERTPRRDELLDRLGGLDTLSESGKKAVRDQTTPHPEQDCRIRRLSDQTYLYDQRSEKLHCFEQEDTLKNWLLQHRDESSVRALTDEVSTF